MRKIAVLGAGAMLAAMFAVPPSFADSRSGYYDSHHHWHSYHRAQVRCEESRQHASNRGAVAGGITGAVLGSAIAGHGAKGEGAAIGAVGGVLTGRQIAKKDHRC